MSNCTLVVGASGTGKSTSIRNLNPKETFIISVLDKPLPFRGYKKHYTPIKGWDDAEGNYFSSDDYVRVLKCIDAVNKNRPDIVTLIIDDFQYLMANEFMRRVSEKGFERFSDIANHAWQIINMAVNTRADLACFILCHSDTDMNGKVKCKTIGKLLDEKITIEGLFTIVLHSLVVDGEYKFLTQFDGTHIAKSPHEMFPDKLIANDLLEVRKAIEEYFNE